MVRLRTAAVVAAMCSLIASVVVISPATAADAASADTAAWCAAVIKANTRFGTMKNKHYLRSALASPRIQKALISYTVKRKAQVLSITPSAIKTAMSHELTYYSHLVANGFSKTTPLAPFTIADSKKLLAYQHAHCGITGP
jgi:hypothetical protein